MNLLLFSAADGLPIYVNAHTVTAISMTPNFGVVAVHFVGGSHAAVMGTIDEIADRIADAAGGSVNRVQLATAASASKLHA